MNVTLTTRAAETNAADNQGSSVLPSSTDALGDKEAFLQLLVAQLKNQDPLNPADGVQFLTQLAQFSQLEQLMGIRGDLQALGNKTTATGADSNSNSGTNSGSSGAAQ